MKKISHRMKFLIGSSATLGVVAVAAPIATTFSSVNQNTVKQKFVNANESKNDFSFLANMTGTRPISKDVNNLPFIMHVPYLPTADGFVKMMLDHKTLWMNSNQVINDSQIRNWFNNNYDLAVKLVEYANVHINQKDFWDAVGDFFEGIGNSIRTAATAIATGVTEATNYLTGDSIPALHDAAKTMEKETIKAANDTAKNFKDMVQEFKKLDWEKILLYAAEVFRDVNFLIGNFGTSILTQIIVDKIVHKIMPVRVYDYLQNYEEAKLFAYAYKKDTKDFHVEFSTDSQKPYIIKTFDGFPPIVWGSYRFKVTLPGTVPDDNTPITPFVIEVNLKA